jgi:MarR family transcriptional regulator, transcriptional regulator for hemolysin
VSDTPRPPLREPIGLALTRTSRAVSRAFDARLAEAGGTLPVWLVLLNLMTREVANQRELAEAVGIQGATLTHHLNGMESAGLLTRRRDPANRRVHVVELTEAGKALFLRLRDAAVEHDQRLRDGFSDDDIDRLTELLLRMRGNVAGHVPPAGIPVADDAPVAGH